MAEDRDPDSVQGSHSKHQDNHSPPKGNATGPPVRKPGSKGHGRKRTKTGCLTCRKRRIKCGEEKPTCQNCVKSKRHCDGYNPRVIFKHPLNSYRPSQSSSSQVTFATPVVGGRTTRDANFDRLPSTASNGQSLAPKPPKAFGGVVRGVDPSSVAPLPLVSPGTERRSYTFFEGGQGDPSPNNVTARKSSIPGLDDEADTIDDSRLPEPHHFNNSRRYKVEHYDFNALTKTENHPQPKYVPTQVSPLGWSAESSPTVPYYQPYPTRTWMHHPNAQFSTGEMYQPRQSVDLGIVLEGVETSVSLSDDHHQHDQGNQLNISTYDPLAPTVDYGLMSPFLERPMVSDQKPEEHCNISEEEAMMEEYHGGEVWQDYGQDDHLKTNDLGVLVAFQANQEDQGLRSRSFTSYIDRSDILATYIPSSQATPLRDRMTARIFCHFVNVTGPSMSIFERRPANPSLMFQGTPIPKSQQHIWTYTFPTLALQNPALLHAMLALGSFHMAKLQGGPITASLKHYHFGIRRVGESVSLPTRRGHPATLAAAMLLAFYECWTADHQKWSNHLLGAKQLVQEIDFSGMTKAIKQQRARQTKHERETQCNAYIDGQNSSYEVKLQIATPPPDDEVDENLVGLLMGKKVRYDQFGRILDDYASDAHGIRECTEKDLEIYETQRDLFWWYAKQDVYQAILGASNLFLDYSAWSNCPPRAPLGRLNAVCGSFDHLILLMGRLADFAARDRKRKAAVMRANGGIWRPAQPPTANNESSHHQKLSPVSPNTPLNIKMPPFNGMIPNVQAAQLPIGFTMPHNASPISISSSEHNTADLTTLTTEALEEWQELRTAFTILEDHFGPGFQPLEPEFSAPINSPFGLALQYRTYSIAGLWMNHYMALIACHRNHPNMPVAAMVAAGVARRQTEWYANQLGRIVAGMAAGCAGAKQVNPGVAGVLIESSTCLFISGIQYTDTTQRQWIIRHLHDVARLTGWQTALAIASGCEVAWMKTAQAGKGPAYMPSSPVSSSSSTTATGGGGYSEPTSPTRIDNTSGMVMYARRIDRATLGLSPGQRREVLEKGDRVHFALGVLGIEADFEGLEVGD